MILKLSGSCYKMIANHRYIVTSADSSIRVYNSEGKRLFCLNGKLYQRICHISFLSDTVLFIKSEKYLVRCFLENGEEEVLPEDSSFQKSPETDAALAENRWPYPVIFSEIEETKEEDFYDWPVTVSPSRNYIGQTKEAEFCLFSRKAKGLIFSAKCVYPLGIFFSEKEDKVLFAAGKNGYVVDLEDILQNPKEVSRVISEEQARTKAKEGLVFGLVLSVTHDRIKLAELCRKYKLSLFQRKKPFKKELLQKNEEFFQLVFWEDINFWGIGSNFYHYRVSPSESDPILVNYYQNREENHRKKAEEFLMFLSDLSQLSETVGLFFYGGFPSDFREQEESFQRIICSFSDLSSEYLMNFSSGTLMEIQY